MLMVFFFFLSLQSLTDTKIVGSRFSPMSVMRVPHQTDFSQSYSQHSLHRSVSQLIDRKSLMMEEGSWDNPLGQDSGLVRMEISYILNPYVTNAVRINDLYIDKKHWCLYCEVKRPFEGDLAPRSLCVFTLCGLIFGYCCKVTSQSLAVLSVTYSSL